MILTLAPVIAGATVAAAFAGSLYVSARRRRRDAEIARQVQEQAAMEASLESAPQGCLWC
jgi:hypothetical protein